MFSNTRLALFFTFGVSLRTWDEVGMLERETAIYRCLQQHGVRLTFVTYGDRRDRQYADRIPGVRVLCNHWMLPSKLYETLLPVLHARHLRRADVYKTNQTKGADVALRAARVFRKPLIARCGYLWSRFAARREGEKSETAGRARRVERGVFTAADRVVVTAEHMKQYVEEQYDIADHKVTVIPNYVLTDLFRPEPGIACEPGRICFVGRLSPQKNLLALLEAAQGLDIELAIIGEGPQREALESAAYDKAVRARFLGNRPHAQLPEHFNAAEIVILPSLYEGHPKVLLEAMACGRPVIGTDVVGIREIIDHRVNGYLCGTSPEEIRSAILDVLRDQELCVSMGRNAREFIVEHFSLEGVVQRELEVLTSVGESGVDRSRFTSAVEVVGILATSLAQVVRMIWLTGTRLAGRATERVLCRALDMASTSQLARLVHRAIARRVDALPADEALRFLFRLDAALYPLWGQQAVDYGGGVHTKHRHLRYHQFFVDRIRKGERVLDIGCGHGALSYDLAEKAGAEVVAIDLNPDNIALAREQHAHPRVVYQIRDARHDLPEGPFDVVVMSNVLEHLSERPALLRHVQELTRASRFLIRVPVFERHWSVPLKRELGVEWRLDPTHETEYTLESFTEEMAAAGLRISHQEVRWGEIWAEAVPNAP